MHPEVVVYAAHCGSMTNVEFRDGPRVRAVATARCAVDPRYASDADFDYAYCVLETPVTDVPIVPIAMGCELDGLNGRAPVEVLGYGTTSADGSGGNVKRAATMAARYFLFTPPQLRVLESPTAAGCPGDSGGPSFRRLADGSYRQTSVHFRTLGCTAGSRLVDGVLAYGVAWIESDSGIDITPCHDADGTFRPGAACAGAPTHPGTGHGAWPTCASGPLGPLPTATCGGAPDAGMADAGAADAGVADAGVADAGAADAGVADAAVDGGLVSSDGGSAPTDAATSDGAAGGPDGGASTDAATSDAARAPDAGAVVRGVGCGCRATSHAAANPTSSGAGAGVSLLLLGLVWRRRRSARAPDRSPWPSG